MGGSAGGDAGGVGGVGMGGEGRMRNQHLGLPIGHKWGVGGCTQVEGKRAADTAECVTRGPAPSPSTPSNPACPRFRPSTQPHHHCSLSQAPPCSPSTPCTRIHNTCTHACMHTHTHTLTCAAPPPPTHPHPHTTTMVATTPTHPPLPPPPCRHRQLLCSRCLRLERDLLGQLAV